MEKGMTIVAAVDKNWGIGAKGQDQDMSIMRSLNLQ